jgi:DNA-binding XRE family transcriptional regulator
MLAAVKTHHTEIHIRGDIPARVLEVLRSEYGQDLKVSGEDGEELVNVFETDWYRSVKATTPPGDVSRVYRETRKFTQSALGRLLGNIARQQISNMENDICPINLGMARKLARVFDVPAERFLAL